MAAGFFVVPPDDAAALSGAIGRWLDEPALRARLRTTARARRMTLTGWPETADEVGRVLEEVR